jgi:hypothetical protein
VELWPRLGSNFYGINREPLFFLPFTPLTAHLLPQAFCPSAVLPRISFFKFLSFQFIGILFLCDYKLQTHGISFCVTPDKASQSLSFSIFSDLYHKLRYVAPGKGKPFSLMPPSWDNSETSSQEDDKREAQGFSSSKHGIYYDSYDEDNQPFMTPTPCGWTQPYLAVVTPEDEEEAKKLH